MSDVAAGPNHYIVTYSGERLNGAVLKNETIIAALKVGKYRSPGADIADESITAPLCIVILLGAQMIHLFEAHGDEHAELVRRIMLLYFVVRNQREASKFRARQIFRVHRKGDYLMLRVMS